MDLGAQREDIAGEIAQGQLKRRPLVLRLFVVFGFNIWFWFTREDPIVFFITTR
jgi:hypothetical protein